jgi:hypothetical protein
MVMRTTEEQGKKFHSLINDDVAKKTRAQNLWEMNGRHFVEHPPRRLQKTFSRGDGM